MSVMWFLTPAKGVIRLKARKTDFSIIRKSLVILLLIAVVVPATTAPSVEAKTDAIPGGPCSKVGKTLNYKGKKLLCKRSGSRLRWVRVSTNGKNPVSTTLPKTQGSTNGKNPVSTTLPETENSTKHPYKLFSTFFRETPVAWPCDAVIAVQMNFDQLNTSMQRQALLELQSAIDEINSHARLKFVIDGTTSEIPSVDATFFAPDSSRNTVVFAFLFQGQSDDLPPWAAGVGGAGADDTSRHHGSVIIDINRLKLSGPGTGNRSRRAVYLHEMLHVVGLDHVKDLKSVMNIPYIGSGTMGPGDIAGVKALGAIACDS